MSDFIYDYVQAYYVSVEQADYDHLNGIIRLLSNQAQADLKADGILQESLFQLSVDMRYIGEAFELTVPLEFRQRVEPKDLISAVDSFHNLHKQLYSFDRPIEPVELIGVRLKVTASKIKPVLRKIGFTGLTNEALLEERPVYFSDRSDFVNLPIYLRNELGEGTEISGPTIIEEDNTTIVVAYGQKAKVDGYGNLIIDTLEEE